MVSWIIDKTSTEGIINAYKEGVCLSTDTKPVNVANGSKLMEMDTSTLYVFDKANNEWRAW